MTIKFFWPKALSWAKVDAVQREQRELVIGLVFSWGLVQIVLKRVCCSTIYAIYKRRSSESTGEFLLIKLLQQLLYSFRTCVLLNKLRKERRIRSSAVIWHPIFSLFVLTCPLTFFIMSVTFKIRVQSTNFQCSCAVDLNKMSLLSWF